MSCCFCYYFVQEQTVDQQPFMIKNPEKLTDKHYVYQSIYLYLLLSVIDLDLLLRTL